MNQLQSFVKKMESIFDQPMFKKFKSYIDNPYVGGLMALVVIIYLSYLIQHIPYHISKWIANPIVKVLLVFTILFLHRMSPILSLIIVIIFMILIYFITRPSSAREEQEEQKEMKPSTDEQIQIEQEIDQTITNNGMRTSFEQPMPVETVGLHPMNRPTEETNFMENKVLDPNDPKHPGWKIMYDPTLDQALYELNPPFAQKELPQDMSDEKPNVSKLNLPKGGPSRYSAFHGYKLA
jgi:uncharacterized membrane protein